MWHAGQSQPPNHLSMFLEVTEPQVSSGSWSYFVSHRLSVVNQKDDSKSVTKESQNRCRPCLVLAEVYASSRHSGAYVLGLCP